MAGAITHLLVADGSLQKIPPGLDRLSRTLNPNKTIMLLGSVCPDLPYATSSLSPQSVWADRMHYQDTNLVPLRMLAMIAQMKMSSERQSCLAFLAGYVAHCVTDATIHPIVMAAVGPYSANKKEHRVCEMIQDSRLYAEAVGKDLRGSHYVGILGAQPTGTVIDAVLGLWAEALQGIHFEVKPEPQPRLWYEAYSTVLSAASDWDLLAKLARPIVGPSGPVYLTEEEIHKEFPHKEQVWYDEIKLPPGQEHKGKFVEDAFGRAIDNVLGAWGGLFSDLQDPTRLGRDGRGGALEAVIHNWDLDTGADMGRPDPRLTYWPLPGGPD